jgi:hypothetical protein
MPEARPGQPGAARAGGENADRGLDQRQGADLWKTTASLEASPAPDGLDVTAAAAGRRSWARRTRMRAAASNGAEGPASSPPAWPPASHSGWPAPRRRPADVRPARTGPSPAAGSSSTTWTTGTSPTRTATAWPASRSTTARRRGTTASRRSPRRTTLAGLRPMPEGVPRLVASGRGLRVLVSV